MKADKHFTGTKHQFLILISTKKNIKKNNNKIEYIQKRDIDQTEHRR